MHTVVWNKQLRNVKFSTSECLTVLRRTQVPLPPPKKKIQEWFMVYTTVCVVSNPTEYTQSGNG